MWHDSISIVIPAYNEAGRILPSLETLGAFCRDRFARFEIICVDDGSSDSTWQVLSGLHDMPFVIPLRLSENRGKGFAIQQGMRNAGGRFLFFTDADLPYRLEALDTAMNAFVQENCDLVVGERELSDPQSHLNVGQARSFASRAFSGLVARLFKLEVRDTQCGFKMFTARATRNLFALQKLSSVIFDPEILWLAKENGFKVAQFPVVWRHAENSRIQYDSLKKSLFVFQELFRIKKLHRRS